MVSARSDVRPALFSVISSEAIISYEIKCVPARHIMYAGRNAKLEVELSIAIAMPLGREVEVETVQESHHPHINSNFSFSSKSSFDYSPHARSGKYCLTQGKNIRGHAREWKTYEKLIWRRSYKLISHFFMHDGFLSVLAPQRMSYPADMLRINSFRRATRRRSRSH